MRTFVPAAAALAAAVTAAGCAPSPSRKPAQPPAASVSRGVVSDEILEAGAKERYAAEAGVSYDPPVALPDNPEPVYPPALLDRTLPPQSVTVALHVDADGRVVDVTPQATADPVPAPFLASVRSAVLQWKFFPLVRVRAGTGPGTVTIGDVTTTYPGQATRLPFSQTYRFVFSRVGGSPQVSASGSDPVR
ncbi:energy transducer TonB [Tahibacter caeni]|uniref:energy transducer TonB n=1 Tax=Tahibacter caeni TaxID=1453545 RepID=UPI002147AC43|nr:energy transducer TonB [Tahibacter caeni]